MPDHRRQRFGHQDEAAARQHLDGRTEPPTDLAAPGPGGVDDGVGGQDLTGGRPDAGDPAAGDRAFGDRAYGGRTV